MDSYQSKVTWQGTVVSVQPRCTVWRYLIDNRTHRENGYNVFLKGKAYDGEEEFIFERAATKYDFCIAISEKQAGKLKPHIGDEIKGTGWTLMYPECEFADLYRAGALKKVNETDEDIIVPDILGLFGKKKVKEYRTVKVDDKTYRRLMKEQAKKPLSFDEMMLYDREVGVGAFSDALTLRRSG